MLGWSRQPGESARAFQAFEHYRDLGPERSVTKVAQALDKSRTLIGRWSSEHDWVSRVEGLEARDAMLQHDAVQEHLRARAEDHAKRETKLRERALEVRERAMDKAQQMLRSPLYRQERRVEMDGEEVTLIMNPAGWTLTTAANLYHLSQNRPGLTEDEIEAVGTLDFSNLSEDEIIKLMDLEAKIVVLPPDQGGGR